MKTIQTKNMFFFTLTFLISFSFFAQNLKGTKLLGVGIGSIYFTNSDSETSYSNTPTVYLNDTRSFGMTIYPSVGWFVKDNFVVGGNLSFNISNSKSDSSNDSNTTTSETKSSYPSLYIGPFARYYFGNSSEGKPFVHVNAQYGLGKGKSESSSSSGSSSETNSHYKTDWNAGLAVGYEYFLSEYIGVYATLGIQYSQNITIYEYEPSTGSGYDYTSDYSRFNVPLNIGLQIHLPEKK